MQQGIMLVDEPVENFDVAGAAIGSFYTSNGGSNKTIMDYRVNEGYFFHKGREKGKE